MKEEFGEVLEVLADSVQKKSDMKNAEWIEDIKNEYDYLNIEKPEQFSLLISLSLDDKADALIRSVLSSINIDNKKKHRLEFAYLQYDFIERHLKSVILKFQGHACSTDKTRWLIDTYVKYLISGELPTIEKKSYWHPACGQVYDWMMWIDSMYELYYGQVEQYILAKDKISKCYENQK